MNFLNYILIMLLAGAGSFGGGLGGVNIIKSFAADYNWILDEQELLRVISISQFDGYSQGMLLAGYLGIKTELGIFGAILGVLAFLLPSIFIIAVILKIGEKLYKNKVFNYSLSYINLLAAGLIGVMLFNYIMLVFGIDPIIYIGIAGVACYLSLYFNLSPVIIIVAGAILGAVFRAG